MSLETRPKPPTHKHKPGSGPHARRPAGPRQRPPRGTRAAGPLPRRDAGSEPISSPPETPSGGPAPWRVCSGRLPARGHAGRFGDLRVGHQTAVAGGGLLRSGAGWLLGGQADLLCCFLMAIKKGDFNVSRGTVALRPWPPACRPWSGRAEARAGRRVTLRGRRIYGGLVTRRPDSCPAPCPGGPSPLPLRWPTAPYTGSLPSSEGVRNAFDLMLRTETPPVGGSVRGGFAIRMQDKPHGSAGHEGGARDARRWGPGGQPGTALQTCP